MRSPIAFMRTATLHYGDVVHYHIARSEVCLVNHPNLIRDVLVTHGRNFAKGGGTEYLKPMLGEGLLTSEGEFHLRQRRLMQPAFHRQRIASYGSVMTDYAAELGERWHDGQTVNMLDEMMSLTLRVVAKTLFSSDVEAGTRTIARAITVGMEWWMTFLYPFADVYHKLPFPINRRFKEARGDLNAVVYGFIKEHRAGGRDRGDLLSMLLMAQDEGDGGGMTDLQVRDEATTILLAGHETTANALTWTWYLLSRHPHVERRLQAEVDEVLQGRLPTVKDLPNLRYTEMVLSEAMRLYPPAWAVARRALNDYQVREYTLPAGTIVSTSQWVMHHDPRYYPDPFRFDPMRWTPEEREKRPKFAYFPFGGGNRICIGEQFAWMEGILVLATLARHWQARVVPGSRIEPQPLVTLRPKYGMPMTLQRRETGSAERRAGEESLALTA